MRPSLLPNMILTALRSLNYGDKSVSIFEIGNVFTDKCEQNEHIAGLRAGNANSRNWLNKQRKFDVYDVKGDLMAILSFYGINENSVKIDSKAPSYYHPSRSGAAYLGRKLIGYFGELHPKITKTFGISERVNCFEIVLESIENGKAKKKQFVDKVFPKIERDFAFIFNFGDNDFSGYVEDVAKMYCEKYNEVMWQIEEYTKFNVSMDSYVEQIEKYESWRVIKELYKSLFNHVKSYYTVRDLKYNNTEFDISKLIEENNKHIKYLGFDDPNKYVFGTNEQITKILDDGYKYEPENENTFYWDNAETLVVRVKNGRMSCKII
jgi:phenylalanyl-tRNA synthetase beta subunit